MKFLKNIAFILFCLFLFNACKTAKVKDGSVINPKDLLQLAAIPQNSLFVVEFKGKDLLEKSGVNKPEQYKTWSLMEKELKREPLALLTLNSFLKEQYPMGLDIDKFYFYATKSNIEKYGAFVVKIHDVKQFETSLKQLGVTEFETIGRFKAITDKPSLLWDNNVLYFIMGRLRNAEEILEITEQTSLVKNADFLKFLAKPSDISCWLQYDAILELSGYKFMADTMKNTFAHVHASFNNGEVYSTASVHNTTGKAIWEGYDLYNKHFQKDLLHIFPEKTFFSTIISFNPKGYTDLIKKMMDSYIAAVNKPYDDYLSEYAIVEPEEYTIVEEVEAFPEIAIVEKDSDNDEIQIAIADVTAEDDEEGMAYVEISPSDDYDDYEDYDDDYNDYSYGNDYKQIMDIVTEWAQYFGGDAVLNVYGFAQGILPIPLAGLNFNVTGEQSFNKLLALLPEDKVQKSEEGYYYISESYIIVYFAYKNNNVLISNDSEIIKKFVEGKKEVKNFALNPVNYSIDDIASSMYLNLNIDEYPENIKIIVNQFLRSELRMNNPEVITNLFKDAYMRSDKSNNGIFSLKFKDTSKNSLKVIFETIDYFVAKEMTRYDDYDY